MKKNEIAKVIEEAEYILVRHPDIRIQEISTCDNVHTVSLDTIKGMLTATGLIHSMLVGKRHHDSGKEFVADMITAYAFCEYGISPKEMDDAVYVEEAEREKKTEE